MKLELSKTVRLIRWNGHEIRYDEGSAEFAHEMLSHNLGMKNASLVQIQQTSDPNTWQCVIVDLPSRDADPSEEELMEMAEAAQPIQNCFLVEMPRENYENIQKARRSKKPTNNVFDLFMGFND